MCDEEQEILTAFDAGKTTRVADTATLLARHREYAEATFRKDARLNIRISSKDLRGLQRRALAVYGESILRDLQKAIYAMQNRPGRLERCMQVMAMTLPKAVLWQKIRALKRVLPRSSTQSTTA